MYKTSESDELIYFAILHRCASPPESVPMARSRVRYPNPISSKAASRSMVLCFMSRAKGSLSVCIHALAFEIDMAQMSAIFLPSILHERMELFSREPPQSGQTPMRNIGSSTLLWSNPSSELMILRYIRGINPSYFALLGQFFGGFFNRICGELRNNSSSSGE